MIAVWAIGVMDLFLTHGQASQPHFNELNPLAASLLAGPLHQLAAFKLGLLTAGSLILLSLRNYWQSELGAWILFASHMALMGWWGLYHVLLFGIVVV